jgi:ferric-dicitrate binding protein FerR (iron transport regulator)
MARDVRIAVEAEWRSRLAAAAPVRRSTAARPAARTTRSARLRRHVPWLAAASVAAIAATLWLAQPDTNGAAIAQVARLDGAVQWRHGDSGAWQSLGPNDTVRAGDELRTTTGAAALRRPDGLELRVGADTQLAFAARDVAELTAGRVYVDAGLPGSGARDFTLQTSLGEVRHLGTQYQAAMREGTLEVSVREGSVSVSHGADPLIARAGERLRLEPAGQVTRDNIERHGDAWAWAEAAVAPYAIEGRSLDEFATWAARETGRQLVYSSPEAARVAEATRLKGSISGLAPVDAVAAVFATAPELQHTFAGGQLRIDTASR